MIKVLSRDKEAPHFQTTAFILLLEQHLMIVVSVRTIIFCFRRWEQGYRQYIYIWQDSATCAPVFRNFLGSSIATMKISILLLASVALADVSTNIYPYDKWSTSDLQQYLKDQGQSLSDYTAASLDDLKKTVSETWENNARPKPWWNFWSHGNSKLPTFGEGKEQVSDWIFDTWSRKDLRKLLSKNGVSFDVDMSRDGLVNAAKKNFDKISKKLGTSGYYPSDSYFQNWDDYDLKAWLDEYRIPYNKAGAKKDELLAKVRENIYDVSRYADDERSNLLESIDLANQQVVDKANQLKEDAFNSWSTDDLKKWLESHKVKVQQKTGDEKEYLVELANKHKNFLKDDIAWYLERAKKESSPLLGKSKEAVSSAWGSTKDKFQGLQGYWDGSAINDAFLIGVESWPKERLRSFLDARGIKYPIFVTRRELVEMVKQYRNEPLKRLQDIAASSSVFEGWSLDNLKQWIRDKTPNDGLGVPEVYQTATDKLHDVLGKAQKQGGDAVTYAQEKGDDVSSLVSGKLDELSESFESWSVEDLKRYLKSYGIHTSSSASKETLLQQAKQNTQWFFGTYKEPYYKKIPRKAREWANYGYYYIFRS